jgi:hypothetical protein
MMAATAETTQFELLDKRVAKLEKIMSRLQLRVETLTPKLKVIPRELLIPLEDPVAEKERVLALLRTKGLISEPTQRERELAAEWAALSEEEKREHRKLMDSLELDPPLSQIILENRR